MQSTHHILMVRPATFGFDPETADSNAFQKAPDGLSPSKIAAKARDEFDGLLTSLRAAGVHLYVVDDSSQPAKPDAVFPNNWLSTHPDGTIILYPMLSKTRREERRQEVLDELERFFAVKQIVDYTHFENVDRYLEGTGSMVFDHENGRVFACRSPRTDEKLVELVADLLDLEPVVFDAVDAAGKPIYHTNVILSLGTKFAVLADVTIPDPGERAKILQLVAAGERRVVKLRPEQLTEFTANILEIEGRERLIALSQRAFQSLSAAQTEILDLFGALIPAPIPTIEQVGGGSVRCMLAEVFLPMK